MLGHLLGLGDDLGRVEQRLGRDAAHVQTDPAEAGVAFDQHDLLAQVGGAEGGGIASGTGAQHDHLAVLVARARLGALGRLRRGGVVLAGLVFLGLALAVVTIVAGIARAFVGPFQNHQHVALGDLVAFLHLDLGDLAGGGGRHLHRGLVRFEFDQRVFLFDRVADRNQDRHNGHILEIADIGNLHIRHVSAPHSISRRASADAVRG